MKVTFPSSVSEPMGLPNSAASPHHVQHVVPDLEGQAQLLGVRLSAAAISRAASARRRRTPITAGPGDHGPGLRARWTSVTSASVCGAWRVSSTWPATMPSAPADLRQDAAAGEPGGSSSSARRRQDQAVGLRLEGVPRQHAPASRRRPCGWWACPGAGRRCPCRAGRRGSGSRCAPAPGRRPWAGPSSRSAGPPAGQNSRVSTGRMRLPSGQQAVAHGLMQVPPRSRTFPAKQGRSR